MTTVARAVDPEVPENRLLAAMPADVLGRLRGHVCTQTLQARHPIYRTNQPFTNVYFPRTGVLSITSLLKSGVTVEGLAIGNEGMVGFEAIAASWPRSIGECSVQTPDAVIDLLPVAVLRQEMHRSPALADLAARYQHLVTAQLLQLVACNATHSVEQRLCRWLLVLHERIGRHIHLSHEFLAMMLGVRRQSVSLVAAGLQQAGLIRYSYGVIEILDPAQLESAACECYGLIRAEEEKVYCTAAERVAPGSIHP